MGKIPIIPDKLIVLEWFELEDPESEPETSYVTVPEAKSECGLRTSSPHTDAQYENDILARAAPDDRKPQKGDSAENSLHATVGSTVRVHDQHTIRGIRDTEQDVHHNDGTVSTQDVNCANPALLDLSPTASTSRLDHAQADYGNLDCTQADNKRLHRRNGTIQEAPEEAVECGVQDVGEDQNSNPEVDEHPSCSTGSSRESEDSFSYPDSELAPSTPPGLSGPPRPLVFGCIDPEYLRRMWEEEGPEALIDTGVWASNVRLPSISSRTRTLIP